MFETVGERRRVDGLALLACTVAAAALIVLLVIGRPADSVFPGSFHRPGSLLLEPAATLIGSRYNLEKERNPWVPHSRSAKF
jgi:hypothetical protein